MLYHYRKRSKKTGTEKGKLSVDKVMVKFNSEGQCHAVMF